jgi:NadR type nicotinamide-nucleotide adenylyltransferase
MAETIKGRTQRPELKKVVVIGPESTGKSTLCAALAEKLNTVWVREYAREYLEALRRPYNETDLLVMARGQIAGEEQAARLSGPLLICDTDLHVIRVWSEHRYNTAQVELLKQIATSEYHLYLLTDIDLVWQDDPLREHPEEHKRSYFYKQYHDTVVNSGIPWINVSGDHEHRLNTSLLAIKEHFGNVDTYPSG